MKTNLILVAVLFITGTAMSQSVSSNSQVSSSANAAVSPKGNQASANSSTTSSTTANASADAASKAEAAANTASEMKESGEARVENGKKAVKDEARSDQHASAGFQGGTTAKVETEHNKGGSNASIKTGSDVSTRSTISTGINTLENTEVATRKTVNASVKSASKAKSKTTAEVKPVRANTKATTSVKAKAVNSALIPGVKGNVVSHSAVKIH